MTTRKDYCGISIIDCRTLEKTAHRPLRGIRDNFDEHGRLEEQFVINVPIIQRRGCPMPRDNSVRARSERETGGVSSCRLFCHISHFLEDFEEGAR
jgi:hypothetical protein